MGEEVKAIKTWYKHQRDIIRDFLAVLEPCTFKATTVTRCIRYRAEEDFLKSQATRLDRLCWNMNGLEVNLKDLHTNVWQLLEVNQENNRNAILVFTIVTIIFMPLSWATSYLGMNTSDIRALRQGQWLFWAVGAPLAAVIIGIALLAVLKGNSIQEFFIRKEKALKTKIKDGVINAKATSMIAIKRSQTLDEKHGVRRRKRRVYPKMRESV